MPTKSGEDGGSWFGTANSYTKSVTVPAGLNRFALVYWSDGNSGDGIATALSLGGVAGTKMTPTGNASTRNLTVWRITAPPVGAQDIVASYTNSVYREGRWAVMFFNDVDQTTPYVNDLFTEDFAWASNPYPKTLTHTHSSSAATHLIAAFANVGIVPSAVGEVEDWNDSGVTTAFDVLDGGFSGTLVGTKAGSVGAVVKADFVGTYSPNHYFSLFSLSLQPASAGVDLTNKCKITSSLG